MVLQYRPLMGKGFESMKTVCATHPTGIDSTERQFHMCKIDYRVVNTGAPSGCPREYALDGFFITAEYI